MEMDLTLWGGLRPLLGHRGDKEEECGGKQGMKKKTFFLYIQNTESKHVWSILASEREGGGRGTAWTEGNQLTRDRESKKGQDRCETGATHTD